MKFPYRRFNALSLALALIAVGVACKGSSKDNQKPATPAGAEAKHAATVVTPGSYEDWCDEHQVPESMCTRCNPSLIAAFKATNDWCQEHGLPESQCKICNPNLKIERPTRPDGK